MEETHYYPFGLTMAGISSKALSFGTPENKIKFQGQEFASKEFSDGSGLEMYEFKWRMHDPQIGRFWQVDPLASDYEYNSTYAFSGNQVTTHVELEGLEPVRYQQPRVNYEQNKMQYRQINSYVPRVAQYRNSGTYIPNQQAGSAARPANIYDDFEPGTGQQHTGPFVTRGNFQGNFAVKMTEAIDDLKGRIESVQVSNTQNVSGMSEATISIQVEIKWNSKEAEAQFNQLQNAYDNKVQEIRDNNKLPPAPGPGASQAEWQQWTKESQKIIEGTNAGIALLGSSPKQQILNSTQNSKEFERVKTQREIIPTISQGDIRY